jgi:putative ABC transport system permease protein
MARDWRAVVRAHFSPTDLEREPEILDELSQHLADIYDEARADGRTDDDAFAIACAALPKERDRLGRDLVTARRSLPGLIADRWTEPALQVTAGNGTVGTWLSGLRRDVIYALKSLRRAPGYVAVALLTLALGIGANSAIFAAVDTILLRPMPYAHPDRLVVPLSEHVARGILANASVSYADYADWRSASDIFEAVALWRPVTVDLTGVGQPERIRTVQVSREYFQVMTMTPVVGRTILPADHEGQAPRVAVISSGLWQRLFGGTPDAVGRTVRIGGVPHEIVGVVPSRAVFPNEVSLILPLPARMSDDTLTRRDNMIFFSIARLRDGVSLEQGNALLATIAARIEREHPESRKGWTNRLQPVREFLVSEGVRRGLWVLLAAVGAVLLIGCANLAHLGLVRGLGRARELGVRIALGASRARLVRELGAECLLIGAAGAIAGVVLAVWMIHALAAIAPPETPFIEDLGLDVRVLAATTILTVLAVLLAGVLPAIATSRVQPGPALKDGSPGAGSSRRVRLLRHSLIVVEIAGAVILLAGSALLIRSFWRLQHVDPGVDVDRVLAARITLSRRYDSDAQSAAFFQRLIERLDAQPGVQSSAATSFVPIGGGGFGLGRVFLAEGWPEPPAGRDVSAQWNVVTPEYFRTIGIPLLQGRSFTRDDRADSTPVAIVSQSFATRMFGSESPLGKRARSWRDENVLREIVGIVGEVRYTGLSEREIWRQFYVPHTQNSWGLMNIVMRSAADSPAALESTIRREVRAIDPDLAVSNVATLRAIARDSVAGERYMAVLLSMLAATALALGAIGIYGVISHVVSMRQRELGLRAALGASPRQLKGLVLVQGLRLTIIGLAIGLTVSLATSRLLQRLLYETEPRDPAAYIATVSMIAIAAGLACLGPARRAARVDPLTSLREA